MLTVIRNEDSIGVSRRIKRAIRSAALFLPRIVLGAVTHVETSQRVAALTFDDGPDPDSTPELLDILQRHGARATFFVVGEAAQQYTQLLQRMIDGGHAIGNHSWDHASLPSLSRTERRRQIMACEKTLSPYSTCRIIRPPYAYQDIRTMLDIRMMGYTTVCYSATGHDWRGDSASAILDRLERGLRPGAILVLHDSLFTMESESYRSRRATLEAVETLLQRHGNRFRFLTVPELVTAHPAKRTWWYRPGDTEILSAVRRAEPRPS